MQFTVLLLGLTALLRSTIAAPTPDHDSVEPRAYLQLFPNLIVNVGRIDRGRYFSTGYTAEMSAELSTLFSFDVPYGLGHPTCHLKFELPPPGGPGGYFPYVVQGSGRLIAIPINGQFTSPTNYDTIFPLLGTPYGTFVVSPTGGVAGFEGGSGQIPCASGTTVQVVRSFTDVTDFRR